MKLCSHVGRRSERGGVLMVTLMIALLIGVTLASYLLLVRNQSVGVARSQAWNTALNLAEAGVEEVLAQLNSKGALTSIAPTGGDWMPSGGICHSAPSEREMAGGRYAAVYTTGVLPVIYSTGYVTVPMTSDIISRVLVIRTTNAPLYTGGFLAGRVLRPGNNLLTNSPITVDSYDSTDTQFSLNGNYDPARAKTPATTNTASLSNMEMPEIQPPFSTGLPMPPSRGDTYRLSGNILIQGDLTVQSGDRLLVSGNRSAVLYVKGNFLMSPSATVEVSSRGSLKIFAQGGNTILGQVNNQGSPTNFNYYGLPGNTNIVFAATNTSLAGGFYAPTAMFSATNGGAPFEFSGALTVNSLFLTRPFRFHFDESLATQPSSPRGRFVVSSWSEN